MVTAMAKKTDKSHDDADGPYVMHRIPTKGRVRLPATFPVPDDLTDAQWTELQVFAVYPLMFAALQPDEMAVLQIIRLALAT